MLSAGRNEYMVTEGRRREEVSIFSIVVCADQASKLNCKFVSYHDKKYTS